MLVEVLSWPVSRSSAFGLVHWNVGELHLLFSEECFDLT